jgi:hypothetical protein
MKSQSLPHTCHETQDILCEKNHILLSCLQEMKTNTQKRVKEIRHSSSLVVLVHLNKLKLIGYVDSKGLWEDEGLQVERERETWYWYTSGYHHANSLILLCLEQSFSDRIYMYKILVRRQIGFSKDKICVWLFLLGLQFLHNSKTLF